VPTVWDAGDRVRICLVYDCLFPHTVGGAERWYRNLAERLVAAGHEVTYLTLRQWEHGEEPDIHGVRVIAVGPRMELYVHGRRRIGPPLRFGAGVLWHLARHGRRYDVVHTASFPYFSLLAAALVRPLAGYELVADWHEVWSAEYWREYLGRAGWIGVAVQRRCARLRQRAFCFSRLHAARLREAGLRGEVTILEGEYVGSLVAEDPLEPEALVVFAGRMIPEKRAPAVVDAVALAAERIGDLRGVLFGDGPERAEVLARITSLGARGERLTAPGFVESGAVHEALRRASCMILPSRREGYGMIVVEAAACGTPSILVREPDNAAVELIEEGVNGLLARSAAPADLAAAIVDAHEAGAPLRERTREWFARNVARLSLEHSLEQVLASYQPARRVPSSSP
jgi:glycosyltransferase involved in cell wall biosynthesis